MATVVAPKTAMLSAHTGASGDRSLNLLNPSELLPIYKYKTSWHCHTS
ncbi:hypothetical protein HMPREF9193_00283 [Treponema lecithinolyticum ATCC 700332]|uniref:Uncharacterized protein n=1 Tax=Treponema lecithinolyticum ATCC 700332 TaxID=1321815 RepID=A0ABN0P1D5_TRELE|nr:hypothetical protein HMPREF9193_00283 [Treponema lecithinolyticum ATCC 700332]